mmetsp:Transcript_29451/g.64725  ORF Transcript_29451/g.64725 Transcript_29451/m.64725 type:complete len:212 (-) Transcript_29451:613-1248(-)
MGLENQGLLVCFCQRFSSEHLDATGVQIPDVDTFVVFQRNRVAALNNLDLNWGNEIARPRNQPILSSLSLCLRCISEFLQRPEEQMVILREDDNILHSAFKLFTRLQEEFGFSLAQLDLTKMLHAGVINGIGNHAKLAVCQRCEVHQVDKFLMHFANVSLCHVNGHQPLCSGSALDFVHIGEAGQCTKLNCSHLGEHFGFQSFEDLFVNRG